MPYNEFGETPEMERRRRKETWAAIGWATFGGAVVFLMLLFI